MSRIRSHVWIALAAICLLAPAPAVLADSHEHAEHAEHGEHAEHADDSCAAQCYAQEDACEKKCPDGDAGEACRAACAEAGDSCRKACPEGGGEPESD